MTETSSRPSPADDPPAVPPRWCIVCTRFDLNKAAPRRGQTCITCELATKRTLTDLLNVLAILPAAYYRSSTGASDKVRGSTEPPMPGGDALVILGPGRPDIVTVGWEKDGTRTMGHMAPDIWREDDPEPVVSALCSWEDDWRTELGHAPRARETWESPEGWDNGQLGGTRNHISRVIMDASRYLTAHNRWAAENHLAYDEYADHLGKLRDRAERVLRSDSLVHRLPVNCPHCAGRLIREDGSDRVRCRKCDNTWDEQGYYWLTVVLAAEEEGKEKPEKKPRPVRHAVTHEGAGFTRCTCGWQGREGDYEHHSDPAWTMPATYAAKALGMKLQALAAYARRNPDLLPRLGRGAHGVSLYAVTDVHRLGEARRVAA